MVRYRHRFALFVARLQAFLSQTRTVTYIIRRITETINANTTVTDNKNNGEVNAANSIETAKMIADRMTELGRLKILFTIH